jgi:hypothetical protein
MLSLKLRGPRRRDHRGLRDPAGRFTDCRIRAAVRAQHSQFAAGQRGEFGELHWKLGHAV